MNSDLDIDERRAAATPRDWPEDFDKETGWNVCERCLHYFLGATSRIKCRQCHEQRTL